MLIGVVADELAEGKEKQTLMGTLRGQILRFLSNNIVYY